MVTSKVVFCKRKMWALPASEHYASDEPAEGQPSAEPVQVGWVPELSSASVVGQRMAISFTIEHPDCLVDGIIEVVWTRESLVSEMMLLQIAPELFDRVVGLN